jgi:hypothetical protein
VKCAWKEAGRIWHVSLHILPYANLLMALTSYPKPQPNSQADIFQEMSLFESTGCWSVISGHWSATDCLSDRAAAPKKLYVRISHNHIFMTEKGGGVSTFQTAFPHPAITRLDLADAK